MNTKKPKIIYSTVIDGEMSCVHELTEEDTDWHYAEIDNFQHFRSRAKAIAEIKSQLRNRIRGLQACIRNLK